MKSAIKLLLSGLFLAAPLFAMAQEEEEAADTYVYATYFYCNSALEEAADAQVETYWKPAYDAAVEAGTISGWGYYSHHTGGQWRRLQWYSAGSIADLLNAQQSVSDAIDEATPEDAANDFGAACTRHDDYIWQVTNGSDGSDETKATLATYHVCDLAKSDRADEIFDSEFAPILDKHVENGNLTGWGWLSHRIGGKIRRIATLAAKDMQSLIKATGEIFPELGATESGDEFDTICSSHSDYLWNVVH